MRYTTDHNDNRNSDKLMSHENPKKIIKNKNIQKKLKNIFEKHEIQDRIRIPSGHFSQRWSARGVFFQISDW
jgi:hypothetical protein